MHSPMRFVHGAYGGGIVNGGDDAVGPCIGTDAAEVAPGVWACLLPHHPLRVSAYLCLHMHHIDARWQVRKVYCLGIGKLTTL